MREPGAKSTQKPGSPPTGGARADELAYLGRVLRDEARAIEAIAERMDGAFTRACDLIEACAGKGGTVLVSGLGKSGHVGAKISATMASLGITSHAVHPTEAAHGDLGRFRSSDVVICLSHSGETDEVVALAATLRQDGLPIIAITRGAGEGEEPSRLERLADVTLAVGVREEAGGGLMAPTSSTTAAMAIGDALALGVARRRNFTNEDFAKRHPGGQLGGLLQPVVELLRFRAGENLPLVSPETSVEAALRDVAKTGRRPGALLVVEHERLVGIFTDGDLRRRLVKGASIDELKIADLMTRDPTTIQTGRLVSEAIRIMRERKFDELPVVDGEGRSVGVLDIQDVLGIA